MSAFKRRRAQFETPHCPSCDSANVVTDNRQGHLVCDDCGVILESSMISTATEYRNFSESDKPTGTLDAPIQIWANRKHELIQVQIVET